MASSTSSLPLEPEVTAQTEPELERPPAAVAAQSHPSWLAAVPLPALVALVALVAA
jgi:hypothetical protein